MAHIGDERDERSRVPRGHGALPAAAPEEGFREKLTVLEEPEPDAVAVTPALPAMTTAAAVAHAAATAQAKSSSPWSTSERVGAADDPVIGQTVGGCVVHRKLGEGGMGAVYLARHELLGLDVVVKVMKPHLAVQAKRVERFVLEARAAARIDHPNVVRVQHIGTSERGLPFIVMQYVEALAHAHQQGVVHGAITPSSVLIDDRGDGVLVDFGVAAAERADRLHARLERAGYVPTASDAAWDLHALGLLLARALAAEVPPRADLLAICRRCLEVDPVLRYASAADLARDLDRAANPAPPQVVRVPQVVFAAALAAAVLVGVVIGTAW